MNESTPPSDATPSTPAPKPRPRHRRLVRPILILTVSLVSVVVLGAVLWRGVDRAQAGGEAAHAWMQRGLLPMPERQDGPRQLAIHAGFTGMRSAPEGFDGAHLVRLRDNQQRTVIAEYFIAWSGSPRRYTLLAADDLTTGQSMPIDGVPEISARDVRDEAGDGGVRLGN